MRQASQGSGFHFLYLTLSVKGLKVDGAVTTNPPFSFLRCLGPQRLRHETDQR